MTLPHGTTPPGGTSCSHNNQQSILKFLRNINIQLDFSTLELYICVAVEFGGT